MNKGVSIITLKQGQKTTPNLTKTMEIHPVPIRLKFNNLSNVRYSISMQYSSRAPDPEAPKQAYAVIASSVAPNLPRKKESR